jgi:hypothetical protein
MRKKYLINQKSLNTVAIIALSLVVSIVTILAVTNLANAADARNFKAGRIIDDNIFSNSDSMTVGDIQRFLDSKVSCDNYGTKRSELGGGTRAQWLAARGISTPITCINQFYENPNNRENNYGKSSIPAGAISAAQIIHNYSNQFSINPQVILVTLQKENGLVTDEWPTPTQYNSALGFGCPDNIAPGAPACDPQYRSFSTQVYQAARHFRGYMDRQYCDFNRGWCTPYRVGVNNIQSQDPRVRDCGTVSINIENRATSALYSYTPYVPNQAALNAQYGSGDGCSAYGNRNFYLYFTDWFGSTLGPAHAWEEVSKNIYTDATKSNQLSADSIRTNQYFFIEYTIRNTGSVVWKKGSVLFGKANSSPSPFCATGWLSCARPSTINTDEVKPGDTTTISFWMQAPPTPGSYKEYYNLVIENYTWFADIGSHYVINVQQKTDAVTKLDSGANRILKRGDYIQSPNGKSILSLSPSGELAIYHDLKKVWSIDRSNINDLVLQTDGNLVAYTDSGDVAWAVVGNNSCGVLSLLDDGSLEYKCGAAILWSHRWEVATASGNSISVNNLLFPGQVIKSVNGVYTLTLQYDGNLVLYNNRGQGVWGSGTNSGAFLVQQSDGNLVLYNNRGQGVWGSSRSGNGIPITTYVQDDGNIVTYTPYSAIWGSR